MKNHTPQNQKNSVVIFKEKQIRRTWHNQEWWFVIYDVVAALTDSLDPSGYIKDMRRRDEELSKGWGQIATPLSVATAGGLQKINCSNTEGVFRLIQRIALGLSSDDGETRRIPIISKLSVKEALEKDFSLYE